MCGTRRKLTACSRRAGRISPRAFHEITLEPTAPGRCQASIEQRLVMRSRVSRPCNRRIRQTLGTTVVETLFVMSLLAIAASVSMTLAGEWRARSRAVSAARLLLTQVRLARAYAVREGV